MMKNIRLKQIMLFILLAVGVFLFISCLSGGILGNLQLPEASQVIDLPLSTLESHETEKPVEESLPATSPEPSVETATPDVTEEPSADEDFVMTEDGRYTSTDYVALYIYTYGKLPRNFITKKEATALGWKSSEGNLWEVTDQFSIGGDVFGNREGLLPSKKGRIWYECDVNYEGGYRGEERIVYSNDGLIYFTSDHYESFTQLY